MNKDLIVKVIAVLGLFWLLAACSTNHSTTMNPQEKKRHAAAGYNVQLGLGYLNQGNMQRAKSKLLQALRQAPDWAPAYDAMGYFLERTGEPEEAKTYYDRALELAPNDGNALNNYGTYLCRQKKYQQAENYFLAAIKDPNYLTTSEAYENAGLCALAIPDDKLAEKYFNKAILQDPQRASSMFELAKLAYKQKQYSLAKQYLDKYLNLVQGNTQVLSLAYQVANELGDKNAAANYAALLNNNAIAPASPLSPSH